MVEEIEKAKNIKENRSKLGKAGAEARWGNGDGKRNADAMPENSTSPSPSPDKERVAKATPKKIGSRLPEGWAPSEADRQYAADLGLNVERTADDFRGYWLAKAGKDAVKLDWSLTWQRWCRREADRRGTSQGGADGRLKPGSL